MTFKALAPEKIEEIQASRKLGQTIEAIAGEQGISVGVVSKYARGIPRPRSAAGAAVAHRERRKTLASANTVTPRPIGKVAVDEATARAVNEADRAEADTRKARAELAYQAAMDEIEDRKSQRRKTFELEAKRQDAEIKETETRAKLVTHPSPELQMQLEQARAATARLERELAEQKHDQRMDELQRGFQGEIDVLSRQMAGIGQTGKGSYDLMSQVVTEAKTLVAMAGGEIHSFVRDNRKDRELAMALSLGLSPAEYDVYRTGPDVPYTRAQFNVLSGGRSQEAMTKDCEEQYQRHLANTGHRNDVYSALQARVAGRLQQAGRQAPAGQQPIAGRMGKVPAPGEPQPPVLSAESKIVTCSRCGTTFDIDLVEARQQMAAGKRLFVKCANPKCGFLLDVTGMIPKLARAVEEAEQEAEKEERVKAGPGPICYLLSEEGCYNRERGNLKCQACAWRDVIGERFE